MIKRTVLVVDDNVINRKLLEAMLKDDYNLLFAEDGRVALEVMRANLEKISAVLLDIVMPVMDGYEVLEAMQQDKHLSMLPVIVLSQKEGDESELKALKRGAHDFLSKPYKADIIKHRLENTIKLRESAALINRAELDELTRLYNKQFFLEKVRGFLREHPDKKMEMVCVGVERFKLVNDVYGTAKADELLKYIADTMLQHKDPDAIFGRFVADMFYALIPDRGAAKSNEEFAFFQKQVNTFPIDMDIKLHCGVYNIDSLDMPPEGMCDRAQLAAEQNKGKYDIGVTFYNDSLRQQLVNEQFITSTMERALHEKQFVVYYQPKYDLNDERIAGAEALVRWIHPERGFMSPGDFIPLFEKNGFITQLDGYVWECVCADMRDWLNKGYPPLAVSINVSRADIYSPNLVERLLGLVAKYEIPMRYLHLEVTESAYTDNPEQIVAVVNRLRDLGFVIEMDDFGSGYSSLNMLAEMPVDILKLDMKFVQNDMANSSNRGILSFIISLAKWLNLSVIAEGVETSEQIATLRSMACDYVQGFYYAKPMPHADFEALLKSSKVTEMISKSETAKQYVAASKFKPLAKHKDRVMLIVDDIEMNRVLLASFFVDEYTIEQAEDGATALKYLEENYEKVDIVLLDLLMPVMDGFQVLREIRKNKDYAKIPVVITSQGTKDSEQRALDMAADDFISKPYNEAIIRHRIHNVLSSYRLTELETTPSIMCEACQEKVKNGTAPRRITTRQEAWQQVERLKPYFDIVRLVDPENTLVFEGNTPQACDMHSCFSVWGKSTRCNNCISLQALRAHTRCNKLEYSDDGLFFVISEYVPYENTGAVIEMVTKLNDEYVDNVFDRNMLYFNLSAISDELDKDPLTGVFNRRYMQNHFGDYLEMARNRNNNLGIAIIDIDYFKKINDTFGHLAGDEALKSIAKLLQDNIASSKGDFVVRYGGDEFLLVCHNIEHEVFAKRVNGVLELAKHLKVDALGDYSISISAGVVNSEEFPELKEMQLFAVADKRLYEVKQSRKINK